MNLTAVATAMLWMGTPPDDSPPQTAQAMPTAHPAAEQSSPAVPTPVAVVPPPAGIPAPIPVQPPAPTAQTQTQPTPGQQSVSDPLVDQDILVTARARSAADPLERVNVQSYKAVQAFDNVLVGPLSKGYKKGVPRPVRDGVHNFLDHVHEPIVFLNYVLQLKPGKAAETLGRFVINSTLGVAGVFDIAKRKPFKLPHRPNSLADTLGYYGVKPGPYFFVPLIGPTTLRDLFGIIVDRSIIPIAAGKPFTSPAYTLSTDVLGALDYRVASDDRLTVLHTANDPYAATRDDYFRKRNAEIDRLHNPAWRARHPRLVPTIVTPPSNHGEVPASTTDAPPPGLSTPVAAP
jgi:phospholipid-binding lipoprotein MlaA